MDQNQFASLIGHAALEIWPDLPRDAQERLFAAAVDDSVIARSLAEFLHTVSEDASPAGTDATGIN